MIVGIIMMTVIPVITFMVLDWNSELTQHASFDVDNSPKPGDKYYIEPERKAQLEKAEQDLRNKIRQLHLDDSLDSGYAINLNHLTKKIEVIVETEQFNAEIEEIISRYPDDIPIVFSNSEFNFEDFPELEHFTIVEGTEIQLEGVVMDMRLGPMRQYSYFTNDPNHTFNTDSNGITLEGLNDKDNLHGKIVKLSGIRTQRDLGIKVTDLIILDSLIPISNTIEPLSAKHVSAVSLETLYANPDSYYNRFIRITGQLSEYENSLTYAGVGCDTAKYTTSDEFLSDFPSSRHLHDGDKKIGVRIESHNDLGKVENPLPNVLKDNPVSVMGVFVPNVVDAGACEHVIHKSGYILTKLDDIEVSGGTK
jgi:hypothetical protein